MKCFVCGITSAAAAAHVFVILLNARSFASVRAFSAVTQRSHHVARRPTFAVVHATAKPKHAIPSELEQHQSATSGWNAKRFIMTVGFVATVAISSTLSFPVASFANTDATGGASVGANAKITTGGASTLQSGRTIAITRGVNLDNSDFHGQNLKGVAFQQSIVRDANFRDTNLVGASFFDATVDGSDFENAYV
jgi:uncharacterized protein YjbI with pentapeptide repeats